MNVVNIGTGFMLPTQAADAFVIDVSPLLIIGALVVLYFIFKKRKNVTSKEFSKNKLDNSNTNVLNEKNHNNAGETLFTLKRTKNTDTNSNISFKKSNEENEEISIPKEKEKIKIFN